MVDIRPMVREDVAVVHSLGASEERFRANEESTGFWTEEQLSRWVSYGKDILLVAEDEGRVIGYALSQTHPGTGKTTIENCYVIGEYRGQGVAKALIGESVRQIRARKGGSICALIEPNNIPIIKVCESAGLVKGKNFTWMKG